MGTQYQPDGLPNITAQPFTWRTGTNMDNLISGALYLDRSVKNYPDCNDDQHNGPRYIFDASRMRNSSNVQIYGVSEWVQPKNVSVLPIIKY